AIETVLTQERENALRTLREDNERLRALSLAREAEAAHAIKRRKVARNERDALAARNEKLERRLASTSRKLSRLKETVRKRRYEELERLERERDKVQERIRRHTNDNYDVDNDDDGNEDGGDNSVKGR